jgi:hypothetical protein
MPSKRCYHVQEVKLADSRAERDLQESLAEIFSIIVTIDELEKAFLKDAIPEADYTEICERSLKQYKSLVADETVAKAFVGLEEFKAEWDVRILHRHHSSYFMTDKTYSSRFPAQRSGYALGCRQQCLRQHPDQHPLLPLAEGQVAR